MNKKQRQEEKISKEREKEKQRDGERSLLQ